MYLIDPPADRPIDSPKPNHRAMFYKGDNYAAYGRTPSVWLLPHSNQMTIRVTTDIDNDSGVESFIAIPNFNWTLLTFVFTNETMHDQQNDTILQKIKSADEKGMEVNTELDINYDENPRSKKNSGRYSIKVYVNSILDIR